MADATTVATVHARRWRYLPLPVRAMLRRRRVAFTTGLLVLAAGLAIVLPMKVEDRVLAAPLVSLAVTVTLYMMVLWSRDGSPPVFEPGTLCMLAITIYGTMPMIGFLMMGGQWYASADGRLQAYPFNAAELGSFGWRYAVYSAAFAITYLLVRGRARVASTAFRVPKPATQAAVVTLLVMLYVAKIGLKVGYGYDPEDFSYTDLAASASAMQSKPYFVLQMGHNILSALFVAQLAVMILLIAYWRKRWCRYLFVFWLTWEVVSSIAHMGSRSRAVLLIISAGVLYHRLVKRIGFRLLAFGGLSLLSGFLVIGVIRMPSSGSAIKDGPGAILMGANEFQGLFTTAFDIHKRKEAGEIASIPWQMYVSDFYMLIPSQILPFDKIDPSSWYIDLIGKTGEGVGYMFGVMSQASVGFNWIELALRGAALAAALAMLHRWYVRRGMYYWPTLFSLFVSIWTYYTFRASTFYFLYFIVYHFVPVYLMTQLLARCLSRVGRARAGAPA